MDIPTKILLINWILVFAAVGFDVHFLEDAIKKSGYEYQMSIWVNLSYLAIPIYIIYQIATW